jgi:hypothetical protein
MCCSSLAGGQFVTSTVEMAKDNPDAAAFMTDPDLNADWSTHDSPDALQSRYAILGLPPPPDTSHQPRTRRVR